ncbi:aldolase [Pseudalkalibacillus caeni]|uniref:Aldolase n=1 Tax=Exobacillus caeni TaxID=2574798 RepID=A0A5R9F408_9BACL|nr:aldolase [Pseudalkalibacillus caeni]TLS35603.1 aldolase [Pseudalkalibacillus caeni]
MILTEKEWIYKAFGLTVKSELLLPELFIENNLNFLIDVEIIIDDLKAMWKCLGGGKVGFILKEDTVLFKLDEIAIFLIESGKKITVCPLYDYKEDIAQMIILGTCMGAVLMQRNILPLHGSAIAINGKAYAIIGDSGAGKSTLASTFIHHNFQILTDDVIAVSLSQDNLPFVIPSYPRQKLWKETLNKFGVASENYKTVYGRQTKYYVPISDTFVKNPLPLAGIFELVKTEEQDVAIKPVNVLEQLSKLFNHTYRNLFISGLNRIDWHFNTSTYILNNLKMYQLCRPVSKFTANELVSIILKTVERENAKSENI